MASKSPEASQIIVNVNPRQTRVAIVEEDRLAELMYEREGSVVGNVYLGVVENVVPALDAAFVDCGIERNVFLHVSDAVEKEPSRKQMRHKMNGFPPIQSVLQKGQKILIQVTKGPVEEKGARATRRISLPGRYLVLTRDGRGKVGVSKKITDEKERDRLRDLAEAVKPQEFGVIVRTRAEGAEQGELEDDVRFLRKLWSSIQGKSEQMEAPALLHEDVSLVFEVVRDVMRETTKQFIVDDKVTYDKTLNLLDNVAPDLRNRVELYREDEPIFTHFGLEKQIARALRPTVWLPHGGYICIEQTEALTAIDVNSGKFTGAKTLEDTVLRTNLEAVDEIARQLRLRDIGGIIVIDLIDMDKQQHRDKVMTALRKAFEHDRMRTRIMHITPLGLVEMTRKRTTQSLQRQLTSTCPCCKGTGTILSAETMAARITEELRLRAATDRAEALGVISDPRVCLTLIGPQGAEAERLEQEIGRELYFRASEAIHPEHYEIVPDSKAALRDRFGMLKKGRNVQLTSEDLLPIPSESLLAIVNGCIVSLPEVSPSVDGPIEARVTSAERSFARATPV